MNKPSLLFFWVYFLMVIITGTLGLYFLEGINYQLTLLLPLLLILLFNHRDQLVINRSVLKAAVFLLVSFILANLFSQHYANSFYYFGHLIAGLTLLIFGALYQNEILRGLPKILIGLGIFYSLYYLALIFLPNLWGFLKPINGFNLVFPFYQYHNHLGDFLVLPILVLLYSSNHKYRLFRFLGVIIFGILVLISYSRSGYVTLALSLLTLFILKIKKKQLNKPLIILVFGLIILAGFTFIVTTKETATYINFFDTVKTKLFINGRDEYWLSAIKSITTYPWFGIGANNYTYAIGRFSEIPFNWTKSALNIFLNFAVENGLLFLLGFVYLIVVVVKNNRFQLPFLLFFACLVNFQTDYTYDITGFWLMFWLIMGLNINNQQNLIELKPQFFYILAIISTIMLFSISSSSLFWTLKQHSLALLTNPVNKVAHEELIIRQLFSQRYHNAEILLNVYQRFYHADSHSQYAAANYYLVLDKPEKALKAYYQAYQWNPYTNLDVYRKIYALEKKLNGNRAANKFLKGYQTKINQLIYYSYFTEQIKKDWREFKRSFELK